SRGIYRPTFHPLVVLPRSCSRSFRPRIADFPARSHSYINPIDIARQYLDDAKIDEAIFYLIESGATCRKQGENFLKRIKTNEELDNIFHMRGYTFIDKGDPDGKTLSFET